MFGLCNFIHCKKLCWSSGVIKLDKGDVVLSDLPALQGAVNDFKLLNGVQHCGSDTEWRILIEHLLHALNHELLIERKIYYPTLREVVSILFIF